MTSDRLTEIVRDTYIKGNHVSAFFIMSAETRQALVGIAAPPKGEQAWAVPQDVWARLTAIPVVLDNATPPNVWRLLDRDGNEIERGEWLPGTTTGDQT